MATNKELESLCVAYRHHFLQLNNTISSQTQIISHLEKLVAQLKQEYEELSHTASQSISTIHPTSTQVDS